MRKTMLVLGILFILTATSQAGFNFGVKTMSLSKTDLAPIVMSTGIPTHLNNNQTLGSYFGIDLGPQVVIFGGLDFTYSRSKEEQTSAGTTEIWEFKFTSFTPNVGVKFYLRPRTSGDIVPYLEGSFFKTFTSVTIQSPFATPADLAFEKELLKESMSPFGFCPAFGVEYYFSNNFSLGGELGLRFSLASAEATEGTLTEKLNNDYISSYIGITLNYRFGLR